LQILNEIECGGWFFAKISTGRFSVLTISKPNSMPWSKNVLSKSFQNWIGVKRLLYE
jgi:hypothetical protein